MWRCPGIVYSPKTNPLVRFLALLRDNPGKKVFVHCRYGDDRTGMMIAAYRMAVEGWTAEEARQEMEKFGFQRMVCPSLVPYEKSFPERLKKTGTPWDAADHSRCQEGTLRKRRGREERLGFANFAILFAPLRLKSLAYASSCSFNFAITLKSSSVVVSPFTSPLVASSRSRRRMIFPLRVLGSASVKRMSSGLARAPISLATHLRSSSFSSGVRLAALLQGDERGDRLAFEFVRTADHGGFGYRFDARPARIPLPSCSGDGRRR